MVDDPELQAAMDYIKSLHSTIFGQSFYVSDENGLMKAAKWLLTHKEGVDKLLNQSDTD